MSKRKKVSTNINTKSISRFKNRQRRFAIIIVSVLVAALILSLAAPLFF